MGRREGGEVDRARLPNAATSNICAHLPLRAPGARLQVQGTTWAARLQLLMRLQVVASPSRDVKKGVRPCLEAEN
jgi:hypothetical protein